MPPRAQRKRLPSAPVALLCAGMAQTSDCNGRPPALKRSRDDADGSEESFERDAAKVAEVVVILSRMLAARHPNLEPELAVWCQQSVAGNGKPAAHGHLRQRTVQCIAPLARAVHQKSSFAVVSSSSGRP